jgi:hypothetical protein
MKTDLRFAVWNELHDGEITVLSQEEPGTLTIFVNIPYVRQRLQPLGDSFRLRLYDFRSITFSNDIGDSSSDLGDIAESQLIIISALGEKLPVQIEVAQGTLVIDFDSLDIALDSGQLISYEQLASSAEEYWNAWQARHKEV